MRRFPSLWRFSRQSSDVCRLGEPGGVDVVLGVLGVDRVVPIVVRVLVSW